MAHGAWRMAHGKDSQLFAMHAFWPCMRSGDDAHVLTERANCYKIALANDAFWGAEEVKTRHVASADT
jgi:hypothetical protein